MSFTQSLLNSVLVFPTAINGVGEAVGAVMIDPLREAAYEENVRIRNEEIAAGLKAAKKAGKHNATAELQLERLRLRRLKMLPMGRTSPEAVLGSGAYGMAIGRTAQALEPAWDGTYDFITSRLIDDTEPAATTSQEAATPVTIYDLLL